MHASSSSSFSFFFRKVENNPPEGALVANGDALGGLLGLPGSLNEEDVYSPELRCEGRTIVPCNEGGHDTLPSLGGPRGGFAVAAAAAEDRGEFGIFVGSSKSRIALGIAPPRFRSHPGRSDPIVICESS